MSAALFMAALASCTSDRTRDYTEAPTNPDDLCSVFDQRRGWKDAVEKSEKRWGAPVPVQMAIVWRESSFRSSVRPSKKYVLGFIPNGHVSSAYGYAQAIDGTWEWYQRETGRSDAERTDFDDAIDFVGWYMAKTRSSNGISPNDAYNHYLAYHEGHTGHRRGSYRTKGWLQGVAFQVSEQAERYRTQLDRCS